MALQQALNYALAGNAVIYRNASPSDYVLEQAADLICAIEYTAIKYKTHTTTATDERFFGGSTNFKKDLSQTDA